MLRLLIVDDNHGFLAAATSLLGREGLTVVGVASNSSEALERIEELVPDVVLLDIELGEESGFEVTRRLHRDVAAGPLRVILISTHVESDFADLIEASPALGFVSKSDLSAEAIRDLLQTPA